MRYLPLVLPCIAALAAPFYNTVEPRLFGFPFFFWFLIVLVPLSAAGIWIASRLGAR